MHTPPVVCEYVEHAQYEDEKCSRPLGFEANSYHDTRRETENRYKDAGNTPAPLYDETDEEEDEKYAAG